MLEEVKAYLKVDDDTGLLELIERGKGYLSRLTGALLDFGADDLPKQLLLDYCRYAINNSLEFFHENFASDLLFLSLQEGVRDMENAAVVTDG